MPDTSSVSFVLESLPSDSLWQKWRGTYTSSGKVARFRIELKSAQAKGQFGTGAGRFVPEADSDATVLLEDLRKALEAKTSIKPSSKRTTVNFVFANLGDHLSLAEGGGFNTTPAGDWSAMKIFFGEGDHESEVFLNLNSAAQKGQISMKDADYGDLVLRELAKVL